MATLVFKVFTLAIKTASKPLANRFQNYVLAHPTLRPQVLKFAQVRHTDLLHYTSIIIAHRFCTKVWNERTCESSESSVHTCLFLPCYTTLFL